jgi:23S rRNA (adenine2503-C2)-methyltransferase
MGGLNDSPEEGLRLGRLFDKLPAKVNLIPYNENPVFPHLKRPDIRKVEEIQRVLRRAGIRALIRKNRGTDIMGACGQLAGEDVHPKTETEANHG